MYGGTPQTLCHLGMIIAVRLEPSPLDDRLRTNDRERTTENERPGILLAFTYQGLASQARDHAISSERNLRSSLPATTFGNSWKELDRKANEITPEPKPAGDTAPHSSQVIGLLLIHDKGAPAASRAGYK